MQVLAVSIRLLFIYIFFSFLIIYPQSRQDSVVNYSLNPVVITAKKITTTALQTDSRIEIIDTETITNSNGKRLGEILKYTGTVNIRTYGHSAALQTASINGLGAAHTLVLFDGVRLNSFQNSELDLSLIPKEILGQIEILSNGAGSLYGSGAVGGVINIIPPNGIGEKDFSFGVSASTGSYSTKYYSVNVSKRFASLSARLFYSNSSSGGNYDYKLNLNGEEKIKERENSGFNGYDVGIMMLYTPGADFYAKYLSTFTRQYKEIAGIETGSAPSISNQLDKNWNNILSMQKALSESIKLNSFLSFQNNYQNYFLFPQPLSTYHNMVYSAGINTEIKAGIVKLITGYETAFAKLESNELSEEAKRQHYAFSFYSEIEPVKDIRFFPSARYEKFSDISQSIFSGGFGTNIKPVAGLPLFIKGNIGKGFRSPSFNDLYWKNSGNKDLKPEKSVSYEAGLVGSFNLFVTGNIELSFREIKADDKIIWTPNRNRLWSPKNISTSVSRVVSVSLSFEKKILRQYSIRFEGGYQLINSKKTSEDYPGDPTFEKYLIYVPLSSANLKLMLKARDIGINIFYTMTGKRYSDQENLVNLEPYQLVSGNISYNYLLPYGSATIRFEVDNLFNVDYQSMPGYPMPLRNYTLTLLFNY